MSHFTCSTVFVIKFDDSGRAALADKPVVVVFFSLLNVNHIVVFAAVPAFYNYGYVDDFGQLMFCQCAWFHNLFP